MSGDISKYRFKDYSYDAEIDGKGVLTVLSDADAIVNAVHIWITSFSGERVRDLGGGGLVTKWLFKPLTEDTRQEVEIAIRMGIENEFSPYLTIKRLSVVADAEDMAWIIYLDTYCSSIGQGVSTIEKIRTLV